MFIVFECIGIMIVLGSFDGHDVRKDSLDYISGEVSYQAVHFLATAFVCSVSFSIPTYRRESVGPYLRQITRPNLWNE